MENLSNTSRHESGLVFKSKEDSMSSGESEITLPHESIKIKDSQKTVCTKFNGLHDNDFNELDDLEPNKITTSEIKNSSNEAVKIVNNNKENLDSVSSVSCLDINNRGLCNKKHDFNNEGNINDDQKPDSTKLCDQVKSVLVGSKANVATKIEHVKCNNCENIRNEGSENHESVHNC